MTESQKPKVLSPEEKQYTVLPNETDPKFSPSKAMAAALRTNGMAKKVRKPR
jgi:hypothetical protein